MRNFRILFLVLIVSFSFALSVYAAPVGTTAGVKELKGNDYISEELKIGFLTAIEGDVVTKRNLDKLEGEAEAKFYTVKLGACNDRLDLYAILGQARDIKYEALVSGADIEYELEDQMVWGWGFGGLIYEWKKLGIKIFGDAKYRAISDMDYDSIVLEGIRYSKDQLTQTKTDAGWKEWQVALSVAKKFEYITPYIGVKFSDIDVSAKVTLDNVTYDLGTINSSQNIGAFTGISLTPIENLSLDLEARFIDEDAFSVALVYEF